MFHYCYINRSYSQNWWVFKEQPSINQFLRFIRRIRHCVSNLLINAVGHGCGCDRGRVCLHLEPDVNRCVCVNVLHMPAVEKRLGNPSKWDLELVGRRAGQWGAAGKAKGEKK